MRNVHKKYQSALDMLNVVANLDQSAFNHHSIEAKGTN